MNGEVFEFGTSGFLYRSNKLMYDRTTNTLWHQFRGEPVVGELADSGITLEVLPVTLTTWGDWLKAHPDTMVLDAETGVYPGESYFPETSSRSIYFDYRQRKDAMFPVPEKSEALPPKSQVLGITFNGQVRAYPQEILDQEPVINDSLGGGDLVVVTPDDGGGSRVYHRSDIHFVRVQRDEGERGSILLIDNAAGSWRLEEDALVHTTIRQYGYGDCPAVQLTGLVGTPSIPTLKFSLKLTLTPNLAPARALWAFFEFSSKPALNPIEKF